MLLLCEISTSLLLHTICLCSVLTLFCVSFITHYFCLILVILVCYIIWYTQTLCEVREKHVFFAVEKLKVIPKNAVQTFHQYTCVYMVGYKEWVVCPLLCSLKKTYTGDKAIGFAHAVNTGTNISRYKILLCCLFNCKDCWSTCVRICSVLWC